MKTYEELIELAVRRLGGDISALGTAALYRFASVGQIGERA